MGSGSTPGCPRAPGWVAGGEWTGSVCRCFSCGFLYATLLAKKRFPRLNRVRNPLAVNGHNLPAVKMETWLVFDDFSLTCFCTKDKMSVSNI